MSHEILAPEYHAFLVQPVNMLWMESNMQFVAMNPGTAQQPVPQVQ
jgi:hypothetical protein